MPESNSRVSMGLNVELLQGAKYDRFMPDIGMEIFIDPTGKTVEQQVEEHSIAIKKMWKKLSDTMENLINEELDRPIKWGKE